MENFEKSCILSFQPYLFPNTVDSSYIDEMKCKLINLLYNQRIVGNNKAINYYIHDEWIYVDFVTSLNKLSFDCECLHAHVISD